MANSRYKITGSRINGYKQYPETIVEAITWKKEKKSLEEVLNALAEMAGGNYLPMYKIERPSDAWPGNWYITTDELLAILASPALQMNDTIEGGLGQLRPYARLNISSEISVAISDNLTDQIVEARVATSATIDAIYGLIEFNANGRMNTCECYLIYHGTQGGEAVNGVFYYEL